MVFKKVRERLRKMSPKKNIAVFVDGPNILRKELRVNLEEVKSKLADFGVIKIGKVFLNQYASDKLIEAVVNQGFEPVIGIGDVDAPMAAEAVETIFNENIQVIAIVTRDADLLSVVLKAKHYGKDTIVLLSDEDSAASLKNIADYVIILGKK